MCWLLYMNLHFIKHTTDGLFLLQDSKVSIYMLFQNFCLGWKLSPIINRFSIDENIFVSGNFLCMREKVQNRKYLRGPFSNCSDL